jgi:hypothetical protein
MAAETHAERGERVVAWLRRFPRLPAMLFLVVIVVVLDVPTVHTVNAVSFIDEQKHIDLVLRGSHGRIGHNGQKLTQETLRELCARGSEIVGYPPCRPGRLNPSEFDPVDKGRNIAAQDPPYPLVTGLTARLLRAMTPAVESLVTWARLLGSVWLLAGMYLVLRIGDLLAVERRLLVVALVLVAALPTQLHASTVVNPDAVAFLAGAAILLAAAAWERGRASLAWLVLAGALALWVDRANGVGVLVALGYLGLRALVGARGKAHGALSWQRCAAAGVAVTVGAVAVVGTWHVVERRLRPEVSEAAQASTPSAPGQTSQSDTRRSTDGLPIRSILTGDALIGMTPPVIDLWPPNRRHFRVGANADWYWTFSVAAALLLTGVLGAAVFVRSGPDWWRILGAATVLALVIAQPVSNVYSHYVNGYIVATVPRFGLSALPAFALLCAVAARRSRAALAGLVVVTAGLYVTAMVTLL